MVAQQPPAVQVHIAAVRKSGFCLFIIFFKNEDTHQKNISRFHREKSKKN